jgi:hypothetical protein
MNWIGSLARIVGTSNPITAMAVQFSAEIEGRAVQERLKLEDPISSLHPDVRGVSRLIYDEVSETDSSKVELSDDQLTQYSRVLAILDANRLIEGSHAIGKNFAAGFWLSNPTYVLYIAALYEDPDLMERFMERLSSTPPKTWMRGAELSQEYALPLPVDET